jgi:Putative transposase/Transposase zinc-binding domain
MDRPPLEVADILRAAGEAFIERHRHWLRWKHVKVLLAIARCRTAALGGHIDECTRCGHRATIAYNSCRNRHCPKCQIAARERWIAARRRELLPTSYLHVVFTLPSRLAPLALQNKKILYDLLFRTSADTLLEVARDPRHLGAELGFFSVLHTWSQQLKLHPHVHCVVPAGGLSPDHTRWIRSRDNYFLPKKVLQKVFRGKFVDAIKQAFQNGQLNFHGDLQLLAQPKIFAAWLRPLFHQHWVVYLKRPFGSPEYVLQYLAATPIAWPSPTIDCSPSSMAKLPFAGVIPLTTTDRSPCLYRSTTFCVASCCTFFRRASCASGISAFWLTGGAKRFCRFAFSCWVQPKNHKLNNTLLPPKTRTVFGAVPTVVAP